MYILSDAATKLNFHCRLSVKEMLKPDEEETLLKKTINILSCCFTFDWNISIMIIGSMRVQFPLHVVSHLCHLTQNLVQPVVNTFLSNTNNINKS